MTRRGIAWVDRPSGDRLDRLARFVSSEPFAVAFVWWAVLVTLAPLCLVCALGFHASGAIEAGVAFGLFGLVLGVLSIRRLVALVDPSSRASTV